MCSAHSFQVHRSQCRESDRDYTCDTRTEKDHAEKLGELGAPPKEFEQLAIGTLPSYSQPVIRNSLLSETQTVNCPSDYVRKKLQLDCIESSRPVITVAYHFESSQPPMGERLISGQTRAHQGVLFFSFF